MKLFKLAFFLACFCSLTAAQTTTTFTGTIKDLTGAAVSSGNITFTLQPGADTTISGSARFTPQTVTCGINGSGAVQNATLTGSCVVTNNTALTPSGTSWKIQICPAFACTSSLVTYALGGSVDITTLVPTPAGMAAYSIVDLFSAQTITGNKIFSGTVTLGTVAGNPTFVGSAIFQNLDSIAQADAFPGATCDAKVTAALAAVGFNGEVWINRNCGLTWVSNVTLSGNQVLRWLQGGTWVFSGSGKITLSNNGNSIIGHPGGEDVAFDCSALAGDCIRWQLATPNVEAVSGTIEGLAIYGGTGGNNVGIHVGDIIGPHIKNVKIANFTGASGAGIWFDNITLYTERFTVDGVWVSNNTSGVLFTNNGGIGHESFAYGNLDVACNIAANNQTCININGSGASNVVNTYAAVWRTRGNINAGVTGAVWVHVSSNSRFGNTNGSASSDTSFSFFNGENNSGNAATGFKVDAGGIVRGYIVSGLRLMTNSGFMQGFTATDAMFNLVTEGLFLGSDGTQGCGLNMGNDGANRFDWILCSGGGRITDSNYNVKWTFDASANLSSGASTITSPAFIVGGGGNPSQTGNVRLRNGDGVSWRNAANGQDLALSVNNSNVISYAGVSTTIWAGADFTLAANTDLQSITGLSFTLPANSAMFVPVSCHFIYTQATAAVADQLGIQSATIAPNNIAAKAVAYTSATAFTAGNLPALNTTTATAVVTFTPSATGTSFNADMDAFIENPSNASTNVINIMAQQSNSADLLTIKRGSFCKVF